MQFSSLASKDGGGGGGERGADGKHPGDNHGAGRMGARRKREFLPLRLIPRRFSCILNTHLNAADLVALSILRVFLRTESFSLSVNFKLKSLSVVVSTCSNLGSNTKSHTMNYRTLIIEKKKIQKLGS